MNKIKYIAAISLFCAIGLTSCTLFGLDLNEDYDYEAKQVDNRVNMTVWEFIQNRPDMFSTLIDGIKYAGIEDLYKDAGNTHILLSDNALSNWESNTNCYWNRNKVPVPGSTTGETMRAGAWEQYSKFEVEELLRYHIIKGEYSFHNLRSTLNWVETYGNGEFTYVKNGETLTGDSAMIDIRVSYDRSSCMQMNNYEWNYRGVLAATTASTRTTNIKATNGYIHVADYYLVRPPKSFMEQ
jgi:uncharacterized surface protein with fasciclin (FAS1) repeats